MAEISDMSTRRLKRHYLRKLAQAWRNKKYDVNYGSYRGFYTRPLAAARYAAAELKRRGWEVPGA